MKISLGRYEARAIADAFSCAFQLQLFNHWHSPAPQTERQWCRLTRHSDRHSDRQHKLEEQDEKLP
eukprot:scaffold98_cov248-Ochromonas_danica.AAC.26